MVFLIADFPSLVLNHIYTEIPNLGDTYSTVTDLAKFLG